MRAELRGKLPGQSIAMQTTGVVKHNPETVLRSTYNLDTGVSHMYMCMSMSASQEGFNIL